MRRVAFTLPRVEARATKRRDSESVAQSNDDGKTRGRRLSSSASSSPVSTKPERLVGVAERHAQLVDGGPVLVFAKSCDVRVAIGLVVEPLQKRGSGPSGDDRVLTTPAAAKAQICARNCAERVGAGPEEELVDNGLLWNDLLSTLMRSSTRVAPERRAPSAISPRVGR